MTIRSITTSNPATSSQIAMSPPSNAHVTPPATVPQEEKPTVQSDEIQPVVVLRGQRAIEFPSRELGSIPNRSCVKPPTVTKWMWLHETQPSRGTRLNCSRP